MFDTKFETNDCSFNTKIESGIKGDNGFSAYDIALKNGFEGSEIEWLESLKGKDGTNGTNGKDGYTPIKGIDYFDGAKGDKGDKGDTGAKGDKGDKGDTGMAGTNGKDGADGKDGYTPVKGVDYFTDADKQVMISELQALQKSETWAFTLDDGSTVEKQVLVK